jgi:hypothetical protein
MPSGLERLPRDMDKRRLWALTEDTARVLSEERTQTAYDEYLHIGCYAFFESCANSAIGEGLDARLSGPTLSPEQAATIALFRGGHRTHPAPEEAARTRLGFLRLTKGVQASADIDHVFTKLVHERSSRPRPTTVLGPQDALRQAFADRKLDVSRHAASKVVVGAAFRQGRP